jgi:hypothetical protein
MVMRFFGVVDEAMLEQFQAAKNSFGQSPLKTRPTG